MTELPGNIRVYRATYQDGNHHFEMNSAGEHEAKSFSEMRYVAFSARSSCQKLQAVGYKNVSIDLKPDHDIIHPCRFCTPLNEEEREEFWKFFCVE
jgi:hypothetical protein